MRKYLTWVLGLCVGVLMWQATPVSAQDATQAMLGLINNARAERGVSPLVANAQLVATAQQHSNDMANGNFLSHTGSDNSQFWDRMRTNGYTMTTGAENVLSRGDANIGGAYDQWYNSSGHRTNMLNSDYLEVGVAYAVAADGRHYFTMVLGTRPGMSAPPVGAVVVPTQTLAPPTRIPPTLPPTQTVIAPTRIPPTLPPTVTPAFAQVILPSATPLGAVNVLPTQTPLAPQGALPSATPAQTFRVFPTLPPNQLPQPNLIMPTASAFGGLSAVPTTVSRAPDFTLVWDSESFALVNRSGGTLDLQGVAFESESGRFDVSQWQTEFLSAPLWAFPNEGCMQVWSIGISFIPNKPAECRWRQVWVAVNDASLFWQDVPRFSVLRDDAVIALCSTLDGVCDVRLDGQVQVVAPSNAPQGGGGGANAGGANVRLIYDADSLTVLNISGAPVSLANLTLTGAQVELSVYAWDNGFLSANLAAFPAGDCLQAWSVNTLNQPKPAACDTRHAWVAVRDSALVWQNGTFSVSQAGQVIATCSAAAGQCEFEAR